MNRKKSRNNKNSSSRMPSSKKRWKRLVSKEKLCNQNFKNRMKSQKEFQLVPMILRRRKIKHLKKKLLRTKIKSWLPLKLKVSKQQDNKLRTQQQIKDNFTAQETDCQIQMRKVSKILTFHHNIVILVAHLKTWRTLTVLNKD